MVGSHWGLGWDEVHAKAFEQFEDHDFELLCRELIEVEVNDRHAAAAELEGPPPKYAQGKDLGFSLTSPPRITREAYRGKWAVPPLTNDVPGRTTVYSCKTGKTWQTKVLEEARKQSLWALDVLHDGGDFVVIVNVPFERRASSAGKRPSKGSGRTANKTSAKTAKSTKGIAASAGIATFEQKLARAYGDRLRERDRNAKDPGDRIRVIDANDLRQFVRGRRPNELSLAFRDKLGTAPIPGLLSLAAWHLFHDRDRGLPGFAWDSGRTALAAQLEAALKTDTSDPYGRAMWLVGPPGVGKTRLVIETLQRDDLLQRRAVVAPSFDEAQAALRDHRLHERYPSAVLIVDDCPPHGLDVLLPWLAQYNHHGTGALVILTPVSSESSAVRGRSGIRRLDLLPLDLSVQREIIALELGEPVGSERVATMAQLTGGFPWYAVLIAREVQRGAPLPKTAADAAKLALCSRHEPGWEEEIWTRARALLVVMLTENIDWQSLSDIDRGELSKAVGLDEWSQVERARRKCVERGLLRIRQKYKYVTPAILEREVARMLLAPPDGDDPLGPSLQRHARRFLSRFYERLQQLGLGADVLAELASPIAHALEGGPPGLSALDHGGVTGAELLFAARYQPIRVARALRLRIKEVPVEVLKARVDVRRDLVFALESLAARRGSFDDAEEALFCLAQAENEAYGNNATSIWASLFYIELNQTYLTFAEKLPLLRARCTAGTAEARVVALTGVGAALATQAWSTKGEALDGPYAAPTALESRKGRLEAWTLLIELMKDADPAVAARAQELGTQELRGAIHSGLGAKVARRFAAAVPFFQERQLRGLRDAVTAAETYDASLLAQTGADEAFRALSEAARPRAFAERLRQRVGSWGPEIDLDDQGLDLELAREGLAVPDHPLLADLPWLATDEAVRSTQFLLALGQVDREGVALEPLLGLARAGVPDPLSAYLRGWKAAGREAEVDALLRALRSDDRLTAAIALTIWRLGATDERIRFLVEDLRGARLPASVIGNLATGSWEKASDDVFGELLIALLDHGVEPAAAVALSMVVRRIKAQGEAPRWKDLLARAVEQVACAKLGGMVARWWELGAKQLIALGEGASVVKLALRILGSDDSLRGPREAWSVLRACTEQDPTPTWREVAPRLEAGDREAFWLAMGLAQHGITQRFRAPDVLAWVGRDSHRAYMAAQMVSMHDGPELPVLARDLIVRFGPEARCARVLASHVRNTPRMVSSLAEFIQAQVERVGRWREGAPPHVRVWGEHLIAELERSHEVHAADEEYERRRWGT